MTIIKCPKCNCDVEINISNAIDSEGEVFLCHNCGNTLRYVEY